MLEFFKENPSFIHFAIETANSALGAILVVPLFLHFSVDRERFRLLLANGFLIFSLSNFLHAIVTNIPPFMIESVPQFFIPLTGFIPRFALPLFLAGAIFSKKHLSISQYPKREIFTGSIIIILITTLFFIILLTIQTTSKLILQNLPIPRPQDILPSLLCLLLIPFYMREKEKLWKCLGAGLILLTFSSIIMSLAKELYSYTYYSAHFLKLMASIIFTFGIIEDSWKSRYSERQAFELNQQLQRINKLKDQLAAMILHDIRAPITAIMCGIDLIVSEQNDISSKSKEQLSLITLEARKILNIANSLLDINKFESGLMKLNTTHFSLIDVTNNEINLMKSFAESNKVEIDFKTDKNIPLCYGDPDIVSRVIVNLLDNALKFSPENSKITVSIESKPENMIQFCIEDKGPGIPQKYHKQIFDKFETLELRYKGRKYSTGLGLTFCKMAVEAHGGTIWLDSEEGKGSRFYFTLPV